MAVHVLTVLAYKEGDRASSSFIAASVNTNPVIIRRLLLTLQQARLIETQKGPGFGSRLSRSAAKINLGEVFRAVERADTFPLPRQKPNNACPVGNCIRSVLAQVFDSARAALEQELQKTSLADILQEVNGCQRNYPPKRSNGIVKTAR